MTNFTSKLSNTTLPTNILVVDDRPENILTIEAVLASPAYHLVTARSGEEALRYVLKWDFAVILLDVQMPGLNGFETAKLIKAREKSKHVPIIFITAISQATDHVKHGYSVGAIDYIFKPFQPETLKLKIDAFIKMHHYQEQIKLQNQLLQITGETSVDTIATLDQQGIILTINRSIVKMFGYNEDQILGHHMNELIANVFDGIHTNQLIGTIIETEAIRKDHSPFPVDIQIGEAKFLNKQIYVCTIRDITIRKLLEEERYRKIFDSTPCLVALRSVNDQRYINVNESWIKHTGYSYEELLNKSDEGLQYIIDDGMGETVVGMFELQHSIRNARISYLTKAGDIREGLLSVELLHIHGEECLLSVITDITDQVHLEKEISRLDRLNTMGEMSAGILHEIRNPITTIRGFLQMSKENPSNEHVDIMVEELDRAHNIITEFLSVTKSNPEKRKKKNLNTIVEILFPLIQSKAIISGKSIALQLEDCPDLFLDEKEMRQLILNLSLNGLEAMNKGGILTIKTYVDSDSNDVTLVVADQGKGIDQDILEKISTPFFTTKTNGTGLGLSICHDVAARHHAEIKVESSKIGTEFYVYFKNH